MKMRPAPARVCEFCNRPFTRKRYANGRPEPMLLFMARARCDRDECRRAGRWDHEPLLDRKCAYAACRRPLVRKRNVGGVWEKLVDFNRRMYCNARCRYADSRKTGKINLCINCVARIEPRGRNGRPYDRYRRNFCDVECWQIWRDANQPDLWKNLQAAKEERRLKKGRFADELVAGYSRLSRER